MDTALLAASTFFAAVAAVAGVAAVVIAGKSLGEASKTITELHRVTAAEQTVAEKSVTTAQLVHLNMLAGDSLAEIESLARLAGAMGEVASACLRIFPGNQPEFLFDVAREGLRAALISVHSGAGLQECNAIVGAKNSKVGQQHLEAAHSEVKTALETAQNRLAEILKTGGRFSA